MEVQSYHKSVILKEHQEENKSGIYLIAYINHEEYTSPSAICKIANISEICITYAYTLSKTFQIKGSAITFIGSRFQMDVLQPS